MPTEHRHINFILNIKKKQNTIFKIFHLNMKS